MSTLALTSAAFADTIHQNDIVLLHSEPGALPAPALEEIIGAIKTLDMDAVRREISEHLDGPVNEA